MRRHLDAPLSGARVDLFSADPFAIEPVVALFEQRGAALSLSFSLPRAPERDSPACPPDSPDRELGHRVSPATRPDAVVVHPSAVDFGPLEEVSRYIRHHRAGAPVYVLDDNTGIHIFLIGALSSDEENGSEESTRPSWLQVARSPQDAVALVEASLAAVATSVLAPAAAEPLPEPATETAVHPAPEPAAESASDPAAGPAAGPTAEPPSEPTVELEPVHPGEPVGPVLVVEHRSLAQEDLVTPAEREALLEERPASLAGGDGTLLPAPTQEAAVPADAGSETSRFVRAAATVIVVTALLWLLFGQGGLFSPRVPDPDAGATAPQGAGSGAPGPPGAPAAPVAPILGGAEIAGRVTRGDTNGSIGGASVVASGPSGPVATITDGQGRWRFTNLRGGTYVIISTVPQFVAGQVRVEVADGQTLENVHLSLDPEG